MAVLGAGVHGSRYAEHLLRGDVPGARLAGVCRRSAAAAGAWRGRGVRFEEVAAALAGDPGVDAVVVASPPGLHEEHALLALDAGKPLLLEKPVAPSPAACRRIREAATRAGVPVLVGHSHRYNPVVRAFREEARRAAPLSLLALSQCHERAPLPWQHRPPGGGALLCLGVHMADLARWITGEAIAAVEGCSLLPGPGGVEETALALGRLASGSLLRVTVSIASPDRTGALRATGPEAALEGDFVLHRLERRRGREREAIPLPPPLPGLVPLLADFLGAVRGEGPGDAATLEDGIAAVDFAAACGEAARGSLGVPPGGP